MNSAFEITSMEKQLDLIEEALKEQKKELLLDPDEEKQKEWLARLKVHFSQGEIYKAKEIVEEIIKWAKEKNITLDVFSACQKGLEALLSKSEIFDAEEIIDWAEEENITLDFSNPEISSACQMGLNVRLSKGEISDAEEIINLTEEKTCKR